MSRQLYEEAIADVKKLKEVAEDNAKRALIEAVTPRIKDLIENELLKETGSAPPDGEENVLYGSEEKDECDEPGAPAAYAAESVEEEYVVGRGSSDALKSLSESINSKEESRIESKLYKLNESVGLLSSASPIVRRTSEFVKEVSLTAAGIEDMYQYLQESVGDLRGKKKYEEKLEKLYQTLNKLAEQNDMKRRKSLLEGDVTLKLTGLPDELDLESIGVDLITGEEGEEEGGDEELDLGGDEEGGEEGEEEGGDEELDLGGDEEGGEEGEKEGGDDELDLDIGGDEGEEEGADEGGEEKEEKMESRRLSDNLVVEIDEGMLRREISRMKTLREARELRSALLEEKLPKAAKGAPKGHGAGKSAPYDKKVGEPLKMKLREEDEDLEEMDELEEIDEMGTVHMQGDQHDEESGSLVSNESDDLEEAHGSEEEEDDLEEAHGSEEEEDDLEEGDYMQAHGEGAEHTKTGEQPSDQSNEPGETVKSESLRRRIAGERRLQAEAKRKAQLAEAKRKKAKARRVKAEQQAQKAGKQGQRGAAAKAKQDANQCSMQEAKMAQAYSYFANKFNESVRRTNKLASLLAEANKRNGGTLNGSASRSAGGTESLRKKLAETNLFNMKLMYTNKLLQNESLTRRQKAEVIERLDEARSDREVRLVYESLVKTLAGTSSRSINESRVLGSSSSPTRPASTSLNEGYEVDRWAKLAGIK